MTPWSDFDTLVHDLTALHHRAQRSAARSVDELLTLRNWLTGAWIIAHQQQGSDRARCGEGLIDALSAQFKAQNLRGYSLTNLRKYREIATLWPRLGIQRTLSVESLLPPHRRALL